MTQARMTLRRQPQLPRRVKAQNSRRLLAFCGVIAARRSTSWPPQWAGFPIPPAPRLQACASGVLGLNGARRRASAPALMSSSMARTQRKGESVMRRTLRSGPMSTAPRPHAEPAAAPVSDERHTVGAGLEAELAELERLSLDDLRLRWRNNWGRLAPAHLSRGLLLRVMAYRLQAEAFGDLDRKTIRMLERLADDAADKSASNGSSTPDPREGLKSKVSSVRAANDALNLKPGALLIREWQGRLERVTVLDGGFAWNGATYASLSAVAFAITGTKWNGHRFFGVRRQDRIGPSEREGDAKGGNGGERSSALARGKADNRPRAARGSSSSSISATTDAGEGIQ